MPKGRTTKIAKRAFNHAMKRQHLNISFLDFYTATNHFKNDNVTNLSNVVDNSLLKKIQ